MYKKNTATLIISLMSILVLILSGCGSGTEDSSNGDKEDVSSSDEKITMKLAIMQPESHTFTVEAVKPFMERVEELTEGKVEFEYYPAEQLGKGSDLLDLTKEGAVDIGYYLPSYYPSKMPISSEIIGLPGMYETSESGTMAFNAIADQTEINDTDFLSNGVRPVLNLLLPSYQFFAKGDEIKVPDDLEGVKVRAPGGVADEALEAAGATALNVSAPEMFESLDKGVIDVINQYAIGIESYGVGELIDNATVDVNFGGLLVGLAINEDLWQNLPEDVQEAIMQAGDEVSESSAIAFDKEEKNIIDKYDESDDIKINTLSDDEKVLWENLYKEFRNTWETEQDDQVIKASEMFMEEIKKN